jgi:ATP synthase protein I
MPDDGTAFGRRIAAQARQKLWAQRPKAGAAWFGLGTFGVIGWSVTVPTLLGAAAGTWWDRHHAGPHSLTLALLVAGLTLGCANAWHWVSAQGRAIRDQDSGASNDS